MAITVTHKAVATGPDDPAAEINAGEWNDTHNAALDGIADVPGLQSALDAKAPLIGAILLNPYLFDTSDPNKGWGFDFSGSFGFAVGTHVSWLTADRTWTWPDKTGTVAFLDDIPSGFIDGGAAATVYSASNNHIDGGNANG